MMLATAWTVSRSSCGGANIGFLDCPNVPGLPSCSFPPASCGKQRDQPMTTINTHLFMIRTQSCSQCFGGLPLAVVVSPQATGIELWPENAAVWFGPSAA